MTRLACFFIPMFPLAARLRSEPSLRDEAVAIVEGNGGAARVVAATRRARKKEIAPGQTLAQARSIMPKLIARSRDAECERTAQEALIEVAETFSPRIEDAGNGVALIDIDGMERHYASEEELAKAAIRACDAVALPARVGIAASKLAARVAAELPKSPVIVAAGQEAAFLAPLPLARLAPEIEAATMLQRFGVTSIGDLARLPESEIASRLGEIGRELHWAARGIDPRPLTPRALPPEFHEGMEVEWPLVALEPISHLGPPPPWRGTLDVDHRRAARKDDAERGRGLFQKLGPKTARRHLKGKAEGGQILARVVLRIGQLRDAEVVRSRFDTFVDAGI